MLTSEAAAEDTHPREIPPRASNRKRAKQTTLLYATQFKVATDDASKEAGCGGLVGWRGLYTSS